ncbi:MAG: hypothetical protein HOK06_08065 [Rhodospirillaceae bacterium]|jgi:hypothetical protein|nr:hypothetical protein [Rhodospirillaceae bacterium]MBT4464206.1 hypothetical protein [Rhodospirillaceae bacterium]MBT5014336.1 hypothetical protein [Rhodospirillaceae bacterium]MBT5308334.1 hypothetical protein [Rhodospirillaceae bacterium]MBT6407545.1 hypothetical protein [Rhodospirillaceae bacterium]
MCTLVILRNPGAEWPLIVAANRDEMLDRPSAPPARHWPDRDHLRAGLDELAGGTWLGVNDYGLMAGVLNRTGTLGSDPNLRSRGELPLEALGHAEATEAARALADLDPAAYRPFNLVVADGRDAFWITSINEWGEPAMRVEMVPTGLSMLTDRELNDQTSGRIANNLSKFKAAAVPDPATGNWRDWQMLLADKTVTSDAREAMNIHMDTGFATVSSSLIALPAPELTDISPVWLFADGSPDKASFQPVD